MRARLRVLVAAVSLGLGLPISVAAQDTNITLPPDSLERLLAYDSFTLPDTLVGTRFATDRTQRVPLFYPDGTAVLVKWAEAPRGGQKFNDNPRYEIAAYEIQKLFLDPPDYVVPPTVPRMFSVTWYRTVRKDAEPTFKESQSVLVVLQYWLYDVTADSVFDPQRFETDSVYARHWGDVNILTYLIDHKDQNKGNLLISKDPHSPRVFAVDNGVAFRSPISDRGARWSHLQVDRLPHHTVDRLRALTKEDLHRALGVLAQFELQGDSLVRVPPGENLKPHAGVREQDGEVQIGLTDGEIDDIWNRLQDLRSDIDRGRLKVF
jgi:hypothetical protein